MARDLLDLRGFFVLQGAEAEGSDLVSRDPTCCGSSELPLFHRAAQSYGLLGNSEDQRL